MRDFKAAGRTPSFVPQGAGRAGTKSKGKGSSWSGVGLTLATWGLSSLFGQRKKRDRNVTPVDYGTPIPRIYGKVRLSGVVVFSQGYKEEKTTSEGGKGPVEIVGAVLPFVLPPPKQTKVVWTGSLALCEGPITRVHTIWHNKKKVYEYNGGNQKGFPLTFDGATDTWKSAPAGGKSSSGSLWITQGTDNHIAAPIVEADFGVGLAPVYPGLCVCHMDSFDTKGGLGLVEAEVESPIKSLGSVCRDIWSLTDTDEDFVDTIDIDGITVDGFALEDRSQAAEALETLASMYRFDWVHRNGKETAVKRGGPVITSIPASDLRGRDVTGSYLDPSPAPDTTFSIAPARDLLRRWELQYYAKQREYNTDVRAGWLEGAAESGGENTTLSSVPIVLSDTAAQQTADILVVAQRFDTNAVSFSTGTSYRWLSPCDPVEIAWQGRTVRVRLVESLARQYGTIEWSAVRDDDGLYQAPVGVPDVHRPPAPMPQFGEPVVHFINSHCITEDSEEMSEPVMYVAATTNGGNTWAPITLQMPKKDFKFSKDTTGGMFTIPNKATIGRVMDALPSLGDPGRIDEALTMTVDIYGNSELVSVTEEELLLGANAAWVKRGNLDDWEIIQWVTSTYNAAGSPPGYRRYTLQGVLRGRRGTDIFMQGHVDGDTFVLIDDAVERISVSSSIWPATGAYTALGGSLVGAAPISGTYTCTRANLRPLSPVIISASRNATTGDWTIQIVRRDRRSESWDGSGIELPSSEAPITFLTVMHNPDGSERVGYHTEFSVTQIPALSWTSGQQSASFGAPQSTLRISIRQMGTTGIEGYSTGVETFTG
jgi:hypothetical protein